jgi:hypothetical protein
MEYNTMGGVDRVDYNITKLSSDQEEEENMLPKYFSTFLFKQSGIPMSSTLRMMD